MRTHSREQRYLGVLQKVSNLTALVFDPQEVMDTIVRSLPELLETDACTIRLLDPSIQTFVLGAAHGVSLEYLSREIIDTEATMAMIQSGHPVFSAHVDEDPFLPFREAARREGIRCVLALPVRFRGEVIGLMRLLTRRDRSFSSEEISFAMALAEQVGIAISHGRLFKEMECQVSYLREIQTISRLVNSTLDLDAVLRTLVERVAVTVDVKGCTLRLLDPDSGRLELAAAYGISAGYLERGAVEGEKNIRLALVGEPVAIYDVVHDQRVAYHQHMAEEGIVSLLAIPVKVDGEVIGVLRVLSGTPRVFTGSEVQFVLTLAEVGGAAIQNARNYGRINELVGRIKAHEQFLANIINSLPHQLLVLDRHRRVVLANRVFLAAMDRTEKDVLGTVYRQHCAGDAVSGSCPVDQVIEGATMQPLVQALEVEGAIRWLERIASPIVDERGQVEHVVEVIRDITAERQLAEERVARGKLEGIIELAGTVAHEINTPLYAALGTAELLVEDDEVFAFADDLAVIIRNLREINQLTRKMTAMTGFTSRDYVGDSKILTINDAETTIPASGTKEVCTTATGEDGTG